jgi:hypothetical protein
MIRVVILLAGYVTVRATAAVGSDAYVSTVVGGFIHDALFSGPPKSGENFSREERTSAPRTASPQPTIPTYYTSVGELLNISFVATADDTATNVAIASWSGNNAVSFTGYEPKMTSKPKGRMAYGEFTWSPGQTGTFTLCANLIDSKLVVQDTICVEITVLNCEHLVQPGETLDSIASLYKITSRTLWWLNPTLNPSPADSSRTVNDDSSLALQVGNVIRIGRTYTLRSGESLTTIVKDLKSSWYWVNQVRPPCVLLHLPPYRRPKPSVAIVFIVTRLVVCS